MVTSWRGEPEIGGGPGAVWPVGAGHGSQGMKPRDSRGRGGRGGTGGLLPEKDEPVCAV